MQNLDAGRASQRHRDDTRMRGPIRYTFYQRAHREQDGPDQEATGAARFGQGFLTCRPLDQKVSDRGPGLKNFSPRADPDPDPGIVFRLVLLLILRNLARNR